MTDRRLSVGDSATFRRLFPKEAKRRQEFWKGSALNAVSARGTEFEQRCGVGSGAFADASPAVLRNGDGAALPVDCNSGLDGVVVASDLVGVRHLHPQVAARADDCEAVVSRV